MSNKEKEVKPLEESKSALPEGVSGLAPAESLEAKVEEKEEEAKEGDPLKEFKEYKVEVIKDFVGQSKGDIIVVSGNVATALLTKKLVKLI